jgi:hypothetical protein
MSTELARIELRSVELTGGRRLDNDYVLVCAGGELPLPFLASVGVSVKRSFGTVEAAPPARRRRSAEEERDGDGRLHVAFLVIGALIIGSLAWLGRDYYPLSSAERLASPDHDALRPAGDLGHGIGIAATVVMLSNFIYPLRKRLGFLKGSAPIGRWLSFHVFVGLLSPAVIVFHAAFQSNNVLASSTFAALLVVVMTGLIGRFVYALVPAAAGEPLSRSEVEAQLARRQDEMRERIANATDPHPLKRAVHRLTAEPPRHILWLLLAAPYRAVASRLALWRLRGLFPDVEDYRRFVRWIRVLERTRAQAALYDPLRRFLSVWRAFHVVLAVFLVLTIAAHIGVSLYLGYAWIFSS